ncbi:MFS transporter [Nocardiopsis sp. EMB25]|uniref:MFS transporter n=1 Tax=Nocardiopsis sp. EMB25 TaxID=2835867 RepID=UPI002284F3CA|nr:MFS transporter [Nocardiopsis sp. EMB25]MCY9786598.1 MFS transporter [Nocardiopsis sp. EMB25]
MRVRAPDASVPVVGARRGLAVLCVTVTTSYGVLFYAFPVLATAITADTGWSSATVTALFSAAQVTAGLTGVLVGRLLQTHGPRPVMTGAALIAVPAVAGIALAPSAVFFALAWIVAGTAMAGLYYPPAFAALTRWYGAARVRALTALTLSGGLASTVFAPVTAALEQAWGWRGAYLVLGGVVALVVVPLHAFALPRAWAGLGADEGFGGPGTTVGTVIRSRAFWALTTALAAGALTVHAGVVNLVPLLESRGFDTTTAAWALGLGGLGQVAGRLVYAHLERRTAPVPRTVIVLAACAATSLLLALVPGPWGLVVAVAVLAGMARGVLTLLHATAVAERWGTAVYAGVSGVMHVPLMLASALAPWIGVSLAGALGGYAGAFAALSALAAAGSVAALFSRPGHSRGRERYSS